MREIQAEIVIIGAGCAGLCAARQAAAAGADALVIDENERPGGQLFKQIHKFFGSKEHQAGSRGFEIGARLLEDVRGAGARVMLNSLVYGLLPDDSMGMISGGVNYSVKSKRIIIASGAKENYLAFPGSTLPGVMGAGAAQTMININRVLPGKRVLMVGSGNVGLIVAYQLTQAGAEVVALVEAAPVIGGYGVHAAKIRRAGVPILLRHTLIGAWGDGEVRRVGVAEVDDKFSPIPGTEKYFDADTICLAVGLNPMTELARMRGCEFVYIPLFGGFVPLHDENMETSAKGIYVAGDITGVEEASTAMEEGNLAGVAAARSLGYLSEAEAERLKADIRARLDALRAGVFGEKRRYAKESQISAMSLAHGGAAVVAANTKHSAAAAKAGQAAHMPEQLLPGVARGGVLSADELATCPGVPPIERAKKGRVAYIECAQEIPCDPCESACRFGAIKVGADITSLPVLDSEKCVGCGQCVPACPGLAIFIVDLSREDGMAVIEFPYEYLPLPEPGSKVTAADREGKAICQGEILSVTRRGSYNGTVVISMLVPEEYAGEARSMRRLVGRDT